MGGGLGVVLNFVCNFGDYFFVVEMCRICIADMPYYMLQMMGEVIFDHFLVH